MRGQYCISILDNQFCAGIEAERIATQFQIFRRAPQTSDFQQKSNSFHHKRVEFLVEEGIILPPRGSLDRQHFELQRITKREELAFLSIESFG